MDLVVPPGRFDYKPTFFFDVFVQSNARLENSSGMSSGYKLNAVMSCTPDPVSLWCCFKDTEVVHDQSFSNHTSSTILPPSGVFNDITSITNEKFLLEFDKTGVKISSCNEKSERSLRMIQKIVDLLNIDVDFDGERRGSSKLETLTIIDDCPVRTHADFKPIGNATINPGDGFFKLMSHPDEFDATRDWSLNVNSTKDIENCKNFSGYFFGSRGDDDYLHGSKIITNIVSTILHILFNFLTFEFFTILLHVNFQPKFK